MTFHAAPPGPGQTLSFEIRVTGHVVHGPIRLFFFEYDCHAAGAHLARRELTVMLRELLTRVPDITAGEPDRLLSSFINGIKRLPCQF